MDRDQMVTAVTQAEKNLFVAEFVKKLDIMLLRLEDLQESVEELTEKINDAMTDRYGTGYSSN